ncbi:hypothetical protein OHA21_15760 [Actinoplanes sp. NBC_00393]|uniref:hypothetical protein n=1 Tax=Actinoplanes sp. NBC_00393 TaxID=2975953 RepID=UPI002E1D8334
MAISRWILLVLMVVVGPLLWWAGVNTTVSAARVASPPGDDTLRYFLSNYHSSALTMVGVFAALNLLLIVVFLPTRRQLREGKAGTLVRAVVAAILITGLAWFEYRFSPVTYNWSGDPDAWSLVKDHITAWHPAVGAFWVLIIATAAAAVATQARVTSRQPADRSETH